MKHSIHFKSLSHLVLPFGYSKDGLISKPINSNCYVRRARTYCMRVWCARSVWPVKDSLTSAVLYWYVRRKRKRHYSMYPSSSYALCLTYNLLGWTELHLHRLAILPLSQTRFSGSYTPSHANTTWYSAWLPVAFHIVFRFLNSQISHEGSKMYIVAMLWTGWPGIPISFHFIAPRRTLHPNQSHTQ